MKNHNDPTPQSTTLAPDFATEEAAHAAGFRPITTAFNLPEELDIALSVAATLRGTAPGSRAVQVAIIGTEHRIQFARRVEDLLGTDDNGPRPPAPAAAGDLDNAVLLPDAA